MKCWLNVQLRKWQNGKLMKCQFEQMKGCHKGQNVTMVEIDNRRILDLYFINCFKFTAVKSCKFTAVIS